MKSQKNSTETGFEPARPKTWHYCTQRCIRVPPINHSSTLPVLVSHLFYTIICLQHAFILAIILGANILVTFSNDLCVENSLYKIHAQDFSVSNSFSFKYSHALCTNSLGNFARIGEAARCRLDLQTLSTSAKLCLCWTCQP